ncbi:MAG: hypothetical protein D6B26_04340, partial [Spirochaetaceae bacterium]
MNNKNTGIIIGLLLLALSTQAQSPAASQQFLREDGSLEAGSEYSKMLKLESPGIVTLTAISLDFQPDLKAFDPSGELLAEGVQQDRSAVLQFFASQPGEYRISLFATDQIQGGERFSLAGEMNTGDSSLVIGQDLFVQMSTAGRSQNSIDWYRLEIPASGQLLVDLKSPNFDTMLTVYLSDGQFLQNDDHGSGTDSRIMISAAPG